MSLVCTEHELLPPRKKAKSKAKTRKKKAPWPPVPKGHLRCFQVGVQGDFATKDMLPVDHLAEVQKICKAQAIATRILGEIHNRKGEPSGRLLVLFFASFPEDDASPHSLFEGVHGTAVLNAKSKHTGRLVNVRRSDPKHLGNLLSTDN